MLPTGLFLSQNCCKLETWYHVLQSLFKAGETVEPFHTAPWLTTANTSEEYGTINLPPSTADKHLGIFGGKDCFGVPCFSVIIELVPQVCLEALGNCINS